jgi:hypothetical protein
MAFTGTSCPPEPYARHGVVVFVGGAGRNFVMVKGLSCDLTPSQHHIAPFFRTTEGTHVYYKMTP